MLPPEDGLALLLDEEAVVLVAVVTLVAVAAGAAHQLIAPLAVTHAN